MNIRCPDMNVMVLVLHTDTTEGNFIAEATPKVELVHKLSIVHSPANRYNHNWGLESVSSIF